MIIKRNIILIGSMGSGKSHFGRNLAEMKNWQFVDTDRVLEGRFGLPIADIFKKIGEKAFKKAELDVLKKVSMYHEAVISVGGNFPIELKTLRALRKYSYIIGIRAAQFRIVSRVNRKIGKRPTMDYDDVSGYVHSMMQLWKPVYKKCDYVLDTTNGRTEDLMQVIEDVFYNEEVLFKTRKLDSKPKKSKSLDIKAKSIQSNSIPSKSIQQHKEGEGYEKSSRFNKRRRRTWHECSHKSNHKKGNS